MNRRHSIAWAAAVTSAAAVLLVGGITWAAIPGEGEVINACYGKLGGFVRVIDTAKKEKCISGLELPISWNQKGAPGNDGDDGDDGVSPTVTPLAVNDPNCPAGGAAITDAHGSTAFVCSGAPGENGTDGEDGEPFSGTFTSPNGQYSISVTDAGISLSSGGLPVVDITGSDVAISAANVQVASDLDTTIATGRDLTVGAGRNATISTANDATLAVSGALSATAATDVSVSVGGNTSWSTGGNAIMSTGANAVVTTGQDLSIEVGGDATLQAARNFSIDTGLMTSINSSGSTSISSSSTSTIEGSQVRLNPGTACRLVARNGDTVNAAGGVITGGSTSVCAG